MRTTVGTGVQTCRWLIERKLMNNHFDQLGRSVAQSVTRCRARKEFALDLAGTVLVLPRLLNKALRLWPTLLAVVTFGSALAVRAGYYALALSGDTVVLGVSDYGAGYVFVR